jgi:hypothetical protein
MLRLHTGIENYGLGRNPWFIEPMVAVVLTDSGNPVSLKGVTNSMVRGHLSIGGNRAHTHTHTPFLNLSLSVLKNASATTLFQMAESPLKLSGAELTTDPCVHATAELEGKWER